VFCRWVVIYLGELLPKRSSEALKNVRFQPYASCYGQGLPSYSCYHKHWWSLTPPFHLLPPKWFSYSLLHLPSDYSGHRLDGVLSHL